MLDTEEQMQERPECESKNSSNSDDDHEGSEDSESRTGAPESKKRKVQRDFGASKPARKKNKNANKNCETNVLKSKIIKGKG